MRGFRIIALALIGILAFDQMTRLAPFSIVSAAWADDDGGDDGDGDDGDDDGDNGDDDGRDGLGGSGRGGGSTSGGDLLNDLRSLFGLDAPRGRPRGNRQPAPQPTPEQAPDEIVARGLTAENIALLEAEGYVVLETVQLTSLATTVQRLQVPAGVSLDAARAAVRALPGGQAADFNHYYRAGQDGTAETAPRAPAIGAACDGLHCPGRALIGWPEAIGPTGCGAPVTIGMIDTGLNPDHEALRSADIALTRVAPEDFSASGAVHGTAVAALLVGDPGTRTPGLLPGMPLVAVDAFHKASSDERADVFTLVRALDLLTQSGVQVINLSLAGPANSLLEDTLTQIATERRITVVAAAGNGGPNAPPAYPAAYDSVIAVTAVDGTRAAYRRAGRGAHVDLAALGVEVWTAASVSGARWMTGTSFAAPYVTAAAALLLQQDPALSPEAVRARLAASAADLGAPGRDDIHGAGLLDLQGRCPREAVYLPASAD